jgi:hypothetical protein
LKIHSKASDRTAMTTKVFISPIVLLQKQNLISTAYFIDRTDIETKTHFNRNTMTTKLLISTIALAMETDISTVSL